ncbi:MAG: AAC(3) family N-acetyltransferase [Deltaproteobacteria bacterium]|nr:AAC(3) family N-acetyltransferase [Deltaproteobacteria bacterium]MBW2018598.1 AAC(3) family N-acetyltransferase [Deltaproteobacteria bacterium]MBW2073864.1 AAC(3) family N-acetyltransferase [Deltaproteobacteria bacterium]
MGYTYKDIVEGYANVSVEKGRVVLVKADLRFLGPFETFDKKSILNAHFNALAELVDLAEGTIVVSTANESLINTDIPYDPEKTPSEMGVLTEHIRQQEGAVRSYHAFESYTAIGKHAKFICGDVARHVYGPETPKARMIEADALCVTIGLPPRLSASTQHHIEFLMGVPYRYTKEYIHPVVKRDGSIEFEPFYRYVLYLECDIKRNKNVKIFNHFLDSGHTIEKSALGRGHVYSFSMADFAKATIQLFKKDIYAWVDEIPRVKPYRR